eukprot:3597995-Prorocentrum_lima.AAC.1
MTSSLVGSEMCIRDSAYTVPSTMFGQEVVSFNHRAGGLHNASSEYRMAVSYTHLTLPTICSV